MIPENVKDMLRSGDLEMAQLGCNVLSQYIKKPFWEKVLEEILNPAFQWDIVEQDIHLRWRPMWTDAFGTVFQHSSGIWTQLSGNYKPIYKIRTGWGGYKMLQEAFEEELKTNTYAKNKRRKAITTRPRAIKNAGRRIRTESKILEGTVRNKGLHSQRRGITGSIRKVPGATTSQRR